jgi:hypothetical protein
VGLAEGRSPTTVCPSGDLHFCVREPLWFTSAWSIHGFVMRPRAAGDWAAASSRSWAVTGTPAWQAQRGEGKNEVQDTPRDAGLLDGRENG